MKFASSSTEPSLFSTAFWTRFKHDLKGGNDERLVQQRNQTAWYAMIVNFIVFMLISTIYALRGEHLPLALQIMFYTPLVTFFLLGIQKDGLAFAIPGIPENEQTLSQSAAVRSLPWVVLITAIVQPFFIDVLGSIQSYMAGYSSLNEALFRGLPTLVITPIFAYWLAFMIKRASSGWLTIVVIASIANIINYGGKFVATYATGSYQWFGPSRLNAYISPTTSPIELMVVFASLWCLGVIVFNGKEMVKIGHTLPDSLSGRKDPPLTPWLYIRNLFLYLVLPIIAVFGVVFLYLTLFS